MISELLMKQSDGKYVLLKDPNKPTVRLYAVPLNTFEEEEEEEEDEEGEDGEEADEEEEDVLLNDGPGEAVGLVHFA